VENKPEQDNRNPTEASKGFLKKMGFIIGNSSLIASVGFASASAGIDYAQGNEQAALVKGAVAASSGITAMLTSLVYASRK
jgi:hypothetical protein